jgi:hypothetical protein
LEEGLDLILSNNSNSNLEDFSIDLSKDFNRDPNTDFIKDLSKDSNKDLNRDSIKRDPLLANKDLDLDSKDSNKGLNFLSNMPKIIDMVTEFTLDYASFKSLMKRRHLITVFP